MNQLNPPLNEVIDSQTQAVIDDCLPLIRPLAIGRYAISIGGSRGKRRADGLSDIDFRLFADQITDADAREQSTAWQAFEAAVARWHERGIEIDGCWARTIGDISATIDQWLAGQARPQPLVWTVWGYHPLTDIANQLVLDDQHGVIAAWQQRLLPFPDALKQLLVKRHLASLRYWRQDYHYRNKLQRADWVFLAGITSRLVHDVMQVLFALNNTHFPGDGNTLSFVADFERVPADFAARVEAILYPKNGVQDQYTRLMDLIDDVTALAATP